MDCARLRRGRMGSGTNGNRGNEADPTSGNRNGCCGADAAPTLGAPGAPLAGQNWKWLAAAARAAAAAAAAAASAAPGGNDGRARFSGGLLYSEPGARVTAEGFMPAGGTRSSRPARTAAPMRPKLSIAAVGDRDACGGDADRGALARLWASFAACALWACASCSWEGETSLSVSIPFKLKPFLRPRFLCTLRTLSDTEPGGAQKTTHTCPHKFPAAVAAGNAHRGAAHHTAFSNACSWSRRCRPEPLRVAAHSRQGAAAGAHPTHFDRHRLSLRRRHPHLRRAT